MDQIYSGGFDFICAVTHSSLEIQSLTLPLNSPKLLDVFNGLHLPKLQRLILVGEIGEAQIVQAMTALDDASCYPRVVEFQTTTPLSVFETGIADSDVEVVTVHGEQFCLIFKQDSKPCSWQQRVAKICFLF